MYYRSYDAQTDTFDATVPVSKTVTEITEMIQSNHLLGSYRVQVGTIAKLKNLLELGVPAGCQLSVYGFKRNTVEGDKPFKNSLRSVCYYDYIGDTGTAQDDTVIMITGSASRILHVPDTSSITMPIAEKGNIVIDYGKPVDIPFADMQHRILVESPVTIAGFAGLTTEGHHGAFLKYAPDAMQCTSEESSFSGANGVYTRMDSAIRFQLTRLLSEVETFYAVFELEGFHVSTGENKSTQYKYMLIELNIIPATMMYYEAEDFTENVFRFEQKQTTKTDEGLKEELVTQWDTEQNFRADEAPQEDACPTQDLHFARPANFYVDFATSDTMHPRFEEEVYRYLSGGKPVNWNDPAMWASTTSSSAYKLIIEAFADTHNSEKADALKVTTNNSNGNLSLKTIYGNSSFLFPLSSAEAFELRVRAENIKNTEDAVLKLVISLKGINDAVTVPIGSLDESGAYSVHSIDLQQYLEGFSEDIVGIKIVNTSGFKNGSILYIDYIYIGTKIEAPSNGGSEEDVGRGIYGFDTTYTNDSQLSNGKSLFIEGKGVKVPNAASNPNYSEACFSFTGTGFDLISRTGAQQATIRATVYSDASMSKESIVKAMTMQNKGELELYQIPVVSMQGFDHGTYYVSIGVNEAKTYESTIPGVDLSVLNRGGEFYFDAIRVYDPINVRDKTLTAQEEIALNAYQLDKETYHYTKEVRNILLTESEFNALSGSADGAVFVDGFTGDDNGHITANIKTYNIDGPKNEVYLAAGQAIAFKLEAPDSRPKSVDIGAKTLLGSSANLVAGFVSGGSETDSVLTASASLNEDIRTRTAQYYKLDAFSLNTNNDQYLVIYNRATDSGTAEDVVLSITDFKLVFQKALTNSPFEDEPDDPEIVKRSLEDSVPFRFTVDGRAADAAAAFIRAVEEGFEDAPCTHTEETIPGTAATCGQDGLTDGIKCSACGEILVEQQVIPATGYHMDVDSNGICDACSYVFPDVELVSRSISLKGNIAVNYYMRLADHVAADPEAYMLFTQEGKELKKIYVRDSEEQSLGGAQYYVFSYEVSAKEMTDEITGQFFYGEKSTEQYPYSVKTYADNVREKITDEALGNLLNAMLHYGAASQLQFNYHTERLANEGMETPNYAEIDLDSYAMSKEQGTALASFAGVSLILKSETTLRFFFELDASVEQFAVTFEGQELEIVERSGLHYVDITDISAPKLDDVFTVTIHDGSQTAEVSYSVLAYCSSVRKNISGKHPQTLLDAVAALYLYNRAANAYFEDSAT